MIIREKCQQSNNPLRGFHYCHCLLPYTFRLLFPPSQDVLHKSPAFVFLNHSTEIILKIDIRISKFIKFPYQPPENLTFSSRNPNLGCLNPWPSKMPRDLGRSWYHAYWSLDTQQSREYMPQSPVGGKGVIWFLGQIPSINIYEMGRESKFLR